MAKRTRLAWLQTTREKTRLLVASAGIAFATILMFMQLGFLSSLFEGATRPHRAFDADLVVTNPRQKTFFSPRSFPRQRLYQALGVPGVESVSGIQLGSTQFRNPDTNELRQILVFGVDPSRRFFTDEKVKRGLSSLKLFNRILFDEGSRPEYGPIARLFAETGKVEVELNERRVLVAGLFKLGASFAADGTIITSDTTFAHLFGRRRADDFEVGLIKLQPGVAGEPVRRALLRMYGAQLSVHDLQDFAEVEKDYWAVSSGIGFIFGLGVVVGFIVGVVIVYQILYADVSDHLSEYATLKAIGYTDGFLLSVLLEESLILSVIGFIPGWLATMILYELARELTLLPIHMTVWRTLFVFVLTVLMCSASAAIAMGKLRQADPADIF